MTGLNGRERELGGGCFLERETDVDFESKYSLFLHLCLFFSSSFLLVILCSSLQFTLIFAPLCNFPSFFSVFLSVPLLLPPFFSHNSPLFIGAEATLMHVA